MDKYYVVKVHIAPVKVEIKVTEVVNHLYSNLSCNQNWFSLYVANNPVDNFGTVVGENPDCLLLSGTVVGENPDHVCWESSRYSVFASSK